MENLQVFSSEEFGEVRVVEIDNEPWFVGKDICAVFGDTNHKRSLGRVADEDKRLIDLVDSLGRTQNAIYVNESGLYSLLFAMQPQKANKGEGHDAYPIEVEERIKKLQKFKHWVTAEVLPSIRKNGGYIAEQETLSDEELLAKALLVAQNKIAERDKRIAEQQKVIEEKSQVIEQQTPLVEFANHVSSATESIEIGTLAKLANKQGIEIGRNRLFNWLRDKKYLMQNNEPYQQYVNQGYFKLIEKTNNTPYGPTIYTQTLVTGKGQIWIIEQLRKEFGSK